VSSARRLAIIGAFALASCSVPETTDQPTSDSPDLAKLQELAERDCTCRMAGHKDSRHGAEYDRLTRSMEKSGYATSSVPVSYESDCFPTLGENACVLTGGYIPPDSENFICTEEQGITLETLWSELDEKTGSAEKADAAIILKLEEMREEARQTIKAADCN
jgi:hypothetical protein